jgi:hypothetical protein
VSTEINDGGSAFPHGEIVQDMRDEKGLFVGSRVWEQSAGMTLRDWFAGRVEIYAYAPMQTFRDNYGREPTINELAEHIAKIRLIEADAMIAAREEKP